MTNVSTPAAFGVAVLYLRGYAPLSANYDIDLTNVLRTSETVASLARVKYIASFFGKSMTYTEVKTEDKVDPYVFFPYSPARIRLVADMFEDVVTGFLIPTENTWAVPDFTDNAEITNELRELQNEFNLLRISWHEGTSEDYPLKGQPLFYTENQVNKFDRIINLMVD